MSEDLDEKRAAGIAEKKDDPWAYNWIGVSIANILEMAGAYPEYFPVEEAVSVIASYLSATSKQGVLPYVHPDKWDAGLRQSVLNKLKQLCDSCEMCELSANRIPGRGSTFGDGKVDADLMGVGEGPGQFEQVTELPFVDMDALRGSTCASKCQNFEACFVTRDDEYARYPQRKCIYTPVKVDEETLKSRIRKRQPGKLATTGQVLGTILKSHKIYRQSFVQVLKMTEQVGMAEAGKYDSIKPGIYLTNAIRCRCTKLDDNNRVKDETPKQEHIDACNPWLEMTRQLVKPKRTVAIGKVGLVALHPELPKGWTITKACAVGNTEDPTVMLSNGKAVFVVLHPSYINRVLNTAVDKGGGPEVYQALLDKFGKTLREAKDLVAREKAEAEAAIAAAPNGSTD